MGMRCHECEHEVKVGDKLPIECTYCVELKTLKENFTPKKKVHMTAEESLQKCVWVSSNSFTAYKQGFRFGEENSEILHQSKQDVDQYLTQTFGHSYYKESFSVDDMKGCWADANKNRGFE